MVQTQRRGPPLAGDKVGEMAIGINDMVIDANSDYV